jgi:amino acid transporter
LSTHVTEHKKGGLGELAATAISGNDITSSCLYVSALAILQAGSLAPVVLLLVGGVLFLFRSIYTEVVGALPLNGGAYNALLNTTSKFRASIAACLTILSYMATAVISANEAMHYGALIWSGLPIIQATVLLLLLFMGLTILGISDSARVAIGIFVVHIFSLTLLAVVGGVYVAFNGFSVFGANLATPPPNGIGAALFFGFAAALLGISGFESSSNFVEEQAEGVFEKTLRNMWLAVTVFNPGMALLALALVPIGDVGHHQEALLAHLGEIAGGPTLRFWISVDAVVVLSGAVLTSFIGVNGLVRRMALDRCLPPFLLVTNRRGVTHRILIAFAILAISVLFITGGDLQALAGVYTISFLGVMALFGVGNILLKVKRSGLPRPLRASWLTVLVGIAAVMVGLAGNIILNPSYFAVFLQYFIPTLLIVSIMLGRVGLLRALLFVVRTVLSYVNKKMSTVLATIRFKIDQIAAQQVVFFTRGDNVAVLNNAMLYVRHNEHTNRMKVVTVVADPADVPEGLPAEIQFLDEAYPEIDIELVVLTGAFTPELIDELSREWDIPKNFMFIGSPTGHLMYGLAELGGVRVVI